MITKAFFERVATARHIVLIAHQNPDADSMGSASAVYSYLLRLQKKITLFCVDEAIDPRLAFLPWVETLKSSVPKDVDLAIAFDCGSASRLGIEVACDLINIDHHASNDGYGVMQIVDAEAISTTQVVYELFRSEGVRINAKMATALYAGLIDDSMGFTAPKTDRRAFEMAAELAGCDADIAACTHHLVQRVSLGATRLKGRMLQELELLREGSVAYLYVSRELLEATGAHAVDCEVPLHEALYLPTVTIAILLRENRDGSLKGSLRSAEGADVSQIAKHFGGGGHRHAAGFEVSGQRPETVLQTILKHLE